jgi:hypothetical protein
MPPKKIGDLSPSEFENFIFDLVIERGFSNVTWRTPGADGGRDIEAISFQRDMSGVCNVEKWYIECKRYQSSIDWPTIHPKIAYADVARADYLLLCTNAKITPNATNQVDEWNRTHRTPRIRLWPGHEIENHLKQHPDLCLKYGLESYKDLPGRSIVSLSLALSKTIASHYSAIVMRGEGVENMLYAGHAIAQLLQTRMDELERDGHVSIRHLSEVPKELPATFSNKPEGLDEPAFLAFCGYLGALVKEQLNVNFPGKGVFEISANADLRSVIERYHEAFSAIALWGDFEMTFNNAIVIVKQRIV